MAAEAVSTSLEASHLQVHWTKKARTKENKRPALSERRANESLVGIHSFFWPPLNADDDEPVIYITIRSSEFVAEINFFVCVCRAHLRREIKFSGPETHTHSASSR